MSGLRVADLLRNTVKDTAREERHPNPAENRTKIRGGTETGHPRIATLGRQTKRHTQENKKRKCSGRIRVEEETGKETKIQPNVGLQPENIVASTSKIWNQNNWALGSTPLQLGKS